MDGIQIRSLFKKNNYKKILLSLLALFIILSNAFLYHNYLQNIVELQTQASSPNNLDVNISSYLGSTGQDIIYTSQIYNYNKIILAGESSNLTEMVQVNLAGKTLEEIQITDSSHTGFVMILSPNGQVVESVISLPSAVVDSSLITSGNILITISDLGQINIIDLTSKLITNTFTAPAGGKFSRVRVDATAPGYIAGIRNGKVSVFGIDGNQIGASFDPVGKQIMDIAVDPESLDLIIVGETQKDGAPCTQYRGGWMRSYKFDGGLNWTNYDWTKEQVVNHCADAMPILVSMGLDGKIYMAAESAGGNTVFAKDPRDLNKAILTKYDQFNDPYNTASNHITFYGRFDAATGNIEKGQMMLSRLSSGAGNTIKPFSIEADEAGNVVLSGESASHFPDRISRSGENSGNPQKTINNTLIAPYAGGEGFVAKISSDFNSRLISTSFTGTDGNSQFYTVATRNEKVVVAGKITKGQQVIVNSLQAQGGGVDGFFAIWGGVVENNLEEPINPETPTDPETPVNPQPPIGPLPPANTNPSACSKDRPCIIFDQELFFSPEKSNPAKYGTEDLIIGLADKVNGEDIKTCKISSRKYGTTNNFVDITDSENATATTCSATISASNQAFNQYDLLVEVETVGGNFYTANPSYFLKLGAIGLVVISANQ